MREQIRDSTDGEEFLKEYFDEEGIDFKAEVTIEGLKGDSIPYRKADFYLPKYKVYVEFLGRWNVDSSKEKYREKIRVYAQNKVPCVYIYPDNLGIINFIFKRKLKKVLKENNMKWQLFKINWLLFQEKYFLNIVILIVLTIYIKNNIAKGVFVFLIVYSIYQSMKEIFFK